MSRTKGLKDGFWLYKVYDVDTNNLLAEGREKDCCLKMGYDQNHYHMLFYYKDNNPNIVPKWERVERTWIPYSYEVTDIKTGMRCVGDKQKCRHWMQNILGKKLTDTNFINYWYGSVKRFQRKRVWKYEEK